jgi:hypothetical protein
VYLPPNIELIYASACAGTELVRSKLLRLGDSTATDILKPCPGGE